jgi:hypothetical protein
MDKITLKSEKTCAVTITKEDYQKIYPGRMGARVIHIIFPSKNRCAKVNKEVGKFLLDKYSYLSWVGKEALPVQTPKPPKKKSPTKSKKSSGVTRKKNNDKT